MEFNFGKYGWKYYNQHINPIDQNISMKIRRFFTMLNILGMPQYLDDEKIYFHNNTFKLEKRSEQLIYLINKNGTYIIHSNKIFMIKDELTYDIDIDFDKIILVSEDLNDIIKLKLFSNELLRENKLNDLLDKTKLNKIIR